MTRVSLLSMTLLHGTVDPKSTLSVLRGNALVLCKICEDIDEWAKDHIKFNEDAYRIETSNARFPPPQGLHINMMSFKLFDTNTLPNECQGYIDMISACRAKVMFNPDAIAHLTIHEGDNYAHARSGIYIEHHRVACQDNRIVKRDINNMEYRCLAWGLGCWDDFPVGGMYIATSEADTAQVWAVTVDEPESVVDEHGGLEYLRGEIGQGRYLKANEICWITDRTPISVDHAKQYQFFMLVVGPVHVCRSNHEHTATGSIQ